MAKITEKTLIPVSIVAVLIAGVFWLGALMAEVKSNSKALEENKLIKLRIFQKLNDISQRLSRIEGMLSENNR